MLKLTFLSSLLLIATVFASESSRCGPFFPNVGCLSSQCCNEYSVCEVSQNSSPSNCTEPSYLLPFLITTEGIVNRCGAEFGDAACASDECCTTFTTANGNDRGCGSREKYCPVNSTSAPPQASSMRCGPWFDGFQCSDGQCCNQFSACEPIDETSDACGSVSFLVPYILKDTQVKNLCGSDFGQVSCTGSQTCSPEGFCESS